MRICGDEAWSAASWRTPRRAAGGCLRLDVSAPGRPDEPRYLEIEFEAGVPVGLDGRRWTSGAGRGLQSLSGQTGVGRIDMIENRLVGLKSREIYEAPAAVVLHAAHRAVEDMTLAQDSLRFKEIVTPTYADLIYNGLWFGALRRDLRPTSQLAAACYRHGPAQALQGIVPRGRPPVTVLAVRQRAGDLWRRRPSTTQAAEGFITLWGLPLRTQARKRSSQKELGAPPRMKTWHGPDTMPLPIHSLSPLPGPSVQDRRPGAVRCAGQHGARPGSGAAGLISQAEAEDADAGAGGRSPPGDRRAICCLA